MNVNDAIAKLQQYPGEMLVFFSIPRTELAYCQVQSVSSKDMTFETGPQVVIMIEHE